MEMSEKKLANKQAHLEDIWECWEKNIVQDVKSLDWKIYKASEDARLCGVNKEMTIAFFQERLSEVIEYVALHRESEKQQALRQKKEIAEWKKIHDLSGIIQIVRPTAKAKAKRKAVKENGI